MLKTTIFFLVAAVAQASLSQCILEFNVVLLRGTSSRTRVVRNLWFRQSVNTKSSPYANLICLCF